LSKQKRLNLLLYDGILWEEVLHTWLYQSLHSPKMYYMYII
jgi:hypothetical protein